MSDEITYAQMHQVVAAIRDYTEHVVVTENRTPDPPEIAHWFRAAVVEQRGPFYQMLIKGDFPYGQRDRSVGEYG